MFYFLLLKSSRDSQQLSAKKLQGVVKLEIAEVVYVLVAADVIVAAGAIVVVVAAVVVIIAVVVALFGYGIMSFSQSL